MKRKKTVNSLKHAEPHEVESAAVKNRLLAGLLLVFCCWHAVFLIVSIIPRRAGQDDAGGPAMDLYRLVTGSRQLWNMFETIPVLHALEARFECDDGKEGRLRTGCVLPGFKRYPKPESVRYYNLYDRLLMNSNGVAFREEYVRRAAQMLSAQRGAGSGGHWSLVMDADYTRNLFHIRRDGKIALLITKTFAPASADGKTP